MIAFTCCEPYPALFAAGLKHIETRPRAINYRGPVIIASGQKIWPVPEYFKNHALNIKPGYAYIKANLVDCIEITPDFIATLSDNELNAGFYTPGRYAWIMQDIETIEPQQMRGYPGVWRVETC